MTRLVPAPTSFVKISQLFSDVLISGKNKISFTQKIEMSNTGVAFSLPSVLGAVVISFQQFPSPSSRKTIAEVAATRKVSVSLQQHCY